MIYKLVSFRGYQSASSYEDALSGAYNQLQTIKRDGYEESFQWVRIESLSGMYKLLYRNIEGSLELTPWMSIW